MLGERCIMKYVQWSLRISLNFKDLVSKEEIEKIFTYINNQVSIKVDEVIVLNKNIIVDPEKAIGRIGIDKPVTIDFQILELAQKNFQEQTTGD